MSAISAIEWTDRTWNPVRGCSIVSPGCVNCYAMKMAHRFSGKGRPYEGLTKQTSAGPQWTGKIRTVEGALYEPLSWRKPQRIFVNSMSDLFHDGVPDAFIDQVFAVMALSPRHTFQILTKRPDRLAAYIAGLSRKGNFTLQLHAILTNAPRPGSTPKIDLPLPNVQLGFSAENQQTFDERWPHVAKLAAAGWTTFCSAEPLLGPINLPSPGLWDDPRKDGEQTPVANGEEPEEWKYWAARDRGLKWLIVGGESGHGGRACDLSWIRSIVDQCKSASVPVFVKQLGGVPMITAELWRAQDRTPLLKAANMARVPDTHVPIYLSDRKGGDPTEWPTDLCVREFPAVRS